MEEKKKKSMEKKKKKYYAFSFQKVIHDLFGMKWSAKEHQQQVRIQWLPISQGWVKCTVHRGHSRTLAESGCLSNCLADHFWTIIIAHCCFLLKKTNDIHAKIRAYISGNIYVIFIVCEEIPGELPVGRITYQFLILQVWIY